MGIITPILLAIVDLALALRVAVGAGVVEAAAGLVAVDSIVPSTSASGVGRRV